MAICIVPVSRQSHDSHLMANDFMVLLLTLNFLDFIIKRAALYRLKALHLLSLFPNAISSSDRV